jgi:hypothetical protein
MQNSGKLVKNSVKNYAQNWWKKNVQKCAKMSFTQKSEKSTKDLLNLIYNYCTDAKYYSSLLRLSFTHFTQSSTITTTIYT